MPREAVSRAAFSSVAASREKGLQALRGKGLVVFWGFAVQGLGFQQYYNNVHPNPVPSMKTFR